MPDQTNSDIEKLRQAISAQEALRGQIPDAVIDTTIAALQGQLAGLEAKLSGTGSIAQGQKTSAATATEGSVAVGRDVGGHLISGDNNRLIGAIINLYQQGDDPQSTDEGALRRQVADYLRGLVNRYSRLELRGIKREGEQVIQLGLEQVYVPLAAKTFRYGDSTEIKLDQVLQQGRHVVITGGPGSGKTTVLLHLTATLALALGSNDRILVKNKLGIETRVPEAPEGYVSWDDFKANATNDKRKQFLREHGGKDVDTYLARFGLPLPIFIPLSSYARYQRELPLGSPAEDHTLAAFISYYLIRRQQGGFDLPGDFFQQLLRTGQQVMVLLDGLDEVPTENERVAVREAIEGLLDGRPELQLIVTCRTAAYGGRAVLGRDFREVMVLPLTEAHIAQLVRKAYAVSHLFGNDPTVAAQKANDLLQAIDNLETQRRRLYGDQTEPLITSPLLVRMLIIVHVSDRRLPDQRAELYKKATDNLLLPEFHPDQEVANEIGGLVGGSQAVHRELAQHLAFEMHQRGNRQSRELEAFELRQILKTHPAYPHLADDFITLARTRNTVLEEQEGLYRFIHLAFQEFLVASYLVDVKGGETGYHGICAFLEHGPLLDSWWREPILLIAGYYSIDKPTAAQKFLRRLAGLDDQAVARAATLPPDVPLAAAELAGAAALEWPALPQTLAEELTQRLADFFSHRSWLTDATLALRTLAADTLAALGDPRSEVMTVDGMQFCCVPPGPFWLGSPHKDDMARDTEKPLHQFKIEHGYWLARYPVTVAQWREFAQGSGHQPTDKDSLHDPLNRPVRRVSWYEAVKFCRWLTKKWWGEEKLPAGWQVRLPSEAEWEKAARGGLEIPAKPVVETLAELYLAGLTNLPGMITNPRPQRRFPWGNEPDSNKANYNDTEIGTTSAVGCFPGGVSPCGAEEMSGNVWEWCLTKWQDSYQNYQNDNDPEGDAARVVRGGAFGYGDKLVRCVCRLGNGPHYGYGFQGFRVVLSPFSSDL